MLALLSSSFPLSTEARKACLQRLQETLKETTQRPEWLPCPFRWCLLTDMPEVTPETTVHVLVALEEWVLGASVR